MAWLSSILWVLFLIVLLVKKDAVKVTTMGKVFVIENPVLRLLAGLAIVVVLGILFFVVGAIFHWIGIFILLPITSLF